MYYERLVNSNWRGNVEIMETKGKDHVFHIFEPDCDEAKEMLRGLALFINQVEAWNLFRAIFLCYLMAFDMFVTIHINFW